MEMLSKFPVVSQNKLKISMLQFIDICLQFIWEAYECKFSVLQDFYIKQYHLKQAIQYLINHFKFMSCSIFVHPR